MFQIILSMRFIMLIASLGAVVGALLMFSLGGVKLTTAAAAFAGSAPLDLKAITASVMGATDAFLFGIVLMIFAYAVAFGFVIEPPEHIAERVPAWMRVSGVGELKHTLIEVIIVYLVVDFATDLAEADTHMSWQALVMPASVVLIAAALRLISGKHLGRNATHRVP